jgi:hypothetical protein
MQQFLEQHIQETNLNTIEQFLKSSVNYTGANLSLPHSMKQSNLLIDMAKTMAQLSNQLYQLHSQIESGKYSTPTSKYDNQIFTPVSSGYNSIASSVENLASFASKRFKHSSCNDSIQSFDLTSSFLSRTSLNSSLSLLSIKENVGESCSLKSNTKKRLFDEISQDNDDQENGDSIIDSAAQTPHRKFSNIQPQSIPRIKEERKRAILLKRKKNFSMIKRLAAQSKIRKSLKFSTPNSKF